MLVVNQRVRATGEVGEGGLVRVESEVVIERREDFAEVDAALGNLPAQSVRRADDLPGAEAATSEQPAAEASFSTTG